MGPEDLAEILSGLDFSSDDENLIISLEDSDDALVYKYDSDRALIKSLDFFTPILDDPYLYGQAAAANSLSDIYAMGGRPVLALNICCFPGSLDKGILKRILAGGVDKCREAGAILGGGHTVEDEEPKYGLSVLGEADPDDIISNKDARPGDRLILSKPLGTGIMSTALMADEIEEDRENHFIKSMLKLNDIIIEINKKVEVRAGTDITGFGLAGHLLEMMEAGQLGCEIFAEKLPYFEGIPDLIASGMMPGGLHKNKETYSDKVNFVSKLEGAEFIEDLLYDPQTSGGLLLSVKEEDIEIAREVLRENSCPSRVIGRVVSGPTRIEIL